PFLLNNTENNRVTNVTIRQNTMAAQYTFFDGSETGNRCLRACISHIGFELNSDGAYRFKAMSKQQVFAFSVDAGTPYRRVVPGMPDLQLSMGDRYIKKPS